MLYLTRPCQYLSDEERRACEVSDWTRGRFREAWVARLDQVIDAEKNLQGAPRIVLAGYSGGGVLAALLAARRRDVACLITVAAPLDHAAWTRLHRVSPLSASLNPADYRTALASIPQVHLTGSEDRVTTPALLENFITAYPPGAPARVLRLPGQDHALAVPPNLADQNVHCALKESCCEKK
jgi:pimeloyl-ACP methyl ester carboxylesterase